MRTQRRRTDAARSRVYCGCTMRIAITGGICEGKSTVLEWLREDGWAVCSSDSVAAEIFARAEINREIARLAGLAHPVEPGALRAAILGSAEVRRSVNRFLHPLITPLILSASGVPGTTFVEVPLLIETCLQPRFDEVWVVTCGLREQRRRLLERYRDKVLVERVLSTQLPSLARLAFADRIVRTNRTLETVRSSLNEVTRELSR